MRFVVPKAMRGSFLFRVALTLWHRPCVCWYTAVAKWFFASLKIERHQLYRFDRGARGHCAVAEELKSAENRRCNDSTLGSRTPAQALSDRQQPATTATWQ